MLVAQLFALLQGDAEPQAQSLTDTPDPSVVSSSTATGGRASVKSMTTTHGSEGTELRLRTTSDGEAAGPARELTIQVTRVLRSHPGRPDSDAAEPLGHVTADWRLPDGTVNRGAFVVVLDSSPA